MKSKLKHPARVKVLFWGFLFWWFFGAIAATAHWWSLDCPPIVIGSPPIDPGHHCSADALTLAREAFFHWGFEFLIGILLSPTGNFCFLTSLVALLVVGLQVVRKHVPSQLSLLIPLGATAWMYWSTYRFMGFLVAGLGTVAIMWVLEHRQLQTRHMTS